MNLTFTPQEMTAALNAALGRESPLAGTSPVLPVQSQAVSFTAEEVQPPALLYLAPDDRIRLSVWTPTAGLSVNLSGRYLLPNGSIVPFRETRRPTGVGTREQFQIEFPECFLTSLEVDVQGENVQPGELYVNVDFVRGSDSDLLSFGHLIQSAVSSLYHPTWPWSPHTQEFDGRGRFFRQSIDQPAVQTAWVVTVPAGRRWRIQGMQFTLTTDLNVANRGVYVGFREPGGSTVFNVPPPDTQAALLTYRYNYFLGGVLRNNNAGIELGMPLPDITLLAGSSIIGSALNLQVGDQFGAGGMWVEDWPESAT